MNLKRKIIWTLSMVLVLIAGAIFFKVIGYEASQEYGRIAADQFRNDESYSILKSQTGVNQMISTAATIVIIIVGFIIIGVWIPLKKKKK